MTVRKASGFRTQAEDESIMFKLITPPGMLFTTALLAILGVYAFLIGSIEDSWPLRAGGLVGIVATFGAAMVKPWSRPLVYLLTAGFAAKLGLSVYDGVTSGFFEFQFGSRGAVMRSLVPSLLMLLLSGLCCVIVHLQFRDTAHRSASRRGPAP